MNSNRRRWLYLVCALVVLFGIGAAYRFFLRTASHDTSRPRTKSAVDVLRGAGIPQSKGANEKAGRYDQDVDLSQLEGEINRTLRKEGLSGVIALVDDSAMATLRGVVNDPQDKQKALKIAQSFKGIRQVNDIIFVVEQ